eukprot:1152459-Pelagomonas_calceolata.AAC.3
MSATLEIASVKGAWADAIMFRAWLSESPLQRRESAIRSANAATEMKQSGREHSHVSALCMVTGCTATPYGILAALLHCAVTRRTYGNCNLSPERQPAEAQHTLLALRVESTCPSIPVYCMLDVRAVAYLYVLTAQS